MRAVYAYISDAAPSLDVTHILRAEFTFVISSFDKYVHDIIREVLMNKFFNGDISENNQLLLSIHKCKKIIDEPDRNKREQLLDSFIVEANAASSFQSPKSVEYAMTLIGITKIWTEVSSCMAMSAKDIKEQLAILVNRRNKIVHEADIEPMSGNLSTMNVCDVELCNDFICKLIDAIEYIIHDDRQRSRPSNILRDGV